MLLTAPSGTGVQARSAFQQQHSASTPRRIVSVRAGVEMPDAFRSALQDALSRDRSAGTDFSSAGYGSESSGYSRPPPSTAAAAANASPMLQILATALGQSRATLERLQAEEAEIENLIQKEKKQVERLEWLLETVQKDYAYFNYLQKKFEEDTRGGQRY